MSHFDARQVLDNMVCGAGVGSSHWEMLWSTGPEWKGVRADLSGEKWVLFSVPLLLRSHLHFFLLYLQLPHMPHISECLMKRSLKPTDLRDMTLGQLQVIVNDLHSQIESKCAGSLKTGSQM